jgi:hypothetical protein
MDAMDLLEPEAAPQETAKTAPDDADALSDVALHRAARMALSNADKAVFVTLPDLIDRVISREVWKKYRWKSWGQYALAGNGLGCNTNSRLWILKCAMDVTARHRRHWAEILLLLETDIRAELRKKHIPVSALRGNSLKSLATRNDFANAPVAYLPSGQGGIGAGDGNLVRLAKSHPKLFERVCDGELTLPAARREAGFVTKLSKFQQIKKWLPSLTVAERAELRQLLSVAA